MVLFPACPIIKKNYLFGPFGRGLTWFLRTQMFSDAPQPIFTRLIGVKRKFSG